MKKFAIALAGLVFVIFAAVGIQAQTTPYPPWLETLYGDVTFTPSGNVTIDTGVVSGDDITEQTAAGEAVYGATIARFIYDVAVDGGDAAAHTLGTSLPAGAVIVRSYFKIITQFDNSGGTVALSCEDANNIKTATDISASSANTFIEGQTTGAASTFVRGIAASCSITATVATVAATAGKLVGWVHYVIEN